MKKTLPMLMLLMPITGLSMQDPECPESFQQDAENATSTLQILPLDTEDAQNGSTTLNPQTAQILAQGCAAGGLQCTVTFWSAMSYGLNVLSGLGYTATGVQLFLLNSYGQDNPTLQKTLSITSGCTGAGAVLCRELALKAAAKADSDALTYAEMQAAGTQRSVQIIPATQTSDEDITP
ncbi:MAG: hypothetical protein LBQ26_01240 [Holosporales bacterium]|nr:hypothetical protein [Holosporales bacterium]